MYVCGARRAFAAKQGAQHPAADAASLCRQLRRPEAKRCNMKQLPQAPQRQCSLCWSCTCSSMRALSQAAWA